jgi:predicted Zn finger-like uncharacterized protein
VYTRCPQCETVFRITAAQLKAREGMVRCGRCQHVFRADDTLVERPAKSGAKTGTRPTGTTRKRGARKTAAAHAAETPLAAALQDSPVSPEAPVEGRAETLPAEEFIPAPLLRSQKARTRALAWALGSTVLVFLLVGQALVFYGQDIARNAPILKPAIELLCDTLPCQKLPPIDMRLMDLVESQVTPHPRYDRALRIKAVIVNRADHVQPYPALEVSLTDSQGQLVARRAYQPREYLRKPDAIKQGLPPQVAETVQLEITSPGAQASGYEILLLPASESK